LEANSTRFHRQQGRDRPGKPGGPFSRKIDFVQNRRPVPPRPVSALQQGAAPAVPCRAAHSTRKTRPAADGCPALGAASTPPGEGGGPHRPGVPHGHLPPRPAGWSRPTRGTPSAFLACHPMPRPTWEGTRRKRFSPALSLQQRLAAGQRFCQQAAAPQKALRQPKPPHSESPAPLFRPLHSHRHREFSMISLSRHGPPRPKPSICHPSFPASRHPGARLPSGLPARLGQDQIRPARPEGRPTWRGSGEGIPQAVHRLRESGIFLRHHPRSPHRGPQRRCPPLPRPAGPNDSRRTKSVFLKDFESVRRRVGSCGSANTPRGPPCKPHPSHPALAAGRRNHRDSSRSTGGGPVRRKLEGFVSSCPWAPRANHARGAFQTRGRVWANRLGRFSDRCRRTTPRPFWPRVQQKEARAARFSCKAGPVLAARPRFEMATSFPQPRPRKQP